MITASVGFQCPECAKTGAKQSRTISAGQALRGRAVTPVVTYTLVALNVLVYVVGVISDRQLGAGGGADSFFVRFSLYPPLVGNGEWYRLITSGFMHAGILHIGFNMWALWVMGPALESILGRLRFTLLYAASLLGGSLGVVLLFNDSQGATVGASGAIFGIFGAYAIVELSRGINPLQSAVGMTILLNLVLTFTISGISIGGHIGGLVVGSVGAAVLLLGRPLPAQSQGEQVGRMAGVAVLGLACFGLALAIAQARYGLA
jgi:membrane associated rhomboid family serine protease